MEEKRWEKREEKRIEERGRKRDGEVEGRRKGEGESKEEAKADERKEVGKGRTYPIKRTIKGPGGELTGGIINSKPQQSNLFANWQPLLVFIIVPCQNYNLSPFFW